MRLESMTPMERTLAALSHKEPDRIPLFLLLTMHGAKELGLTIKDYFSESRHVVEGQIRLLEKYGHDCIYAFFYAPLEVEAWGAEVIYADDGPPNSGAPVVRKYGDIKSLNVPDVKHTPCLCKALDAIRMLKAKVGDTTPIIGVAMSPFSLPVMQMGFEPYLRLIYEESELFRRLTDVNIRFCVDWSNAQLKAGATAICYFDPVSSATIIPRELYLKTGFEIAGRTLSQIKGPTATHMASGRSLPILDDIVKTGTAAVAASRLEDLAAVKERCRNKISVLGNLNGVEMVRWTPSETEQAVKECIAKAGAGGGFILSDNHGEIPFQVTDDTLFAIGGAVRKWGVYPLDWIPADE